MTSKENTIIISLAIILVGFIFIVLGLYGSQFHFGLSNEQSHWGGFGSYVGGTLGALFAFASFTILFYTFNAQQKQAKNNELESFESTLFSLLELHNQSLDVLYEREKEINTSQFYRNLKDSILHSAASRVNNLDLIKSANVSKESKELIVNMLDTELSNIQENINQDIDLSQYFRILYQILKFIAKNNIYNPQRKFDNTYLLIGDKEIIEHEKMYASLVRAFVPVKLLPLIALNGIPNTKSHHNLNLYNSLLERYNFLEHMRIESLHDQIAVTLILSNYTKALGENPNIEDKIKNIHAGSPQISKIPELSKGYLSGQTTSNSD